MALRFIPIEEAERVAARQPEPEGPVTTTRRMPLWVITAWALAQAKAKARKSDEIIGLAQKAGYDLAALKPRLDQ